MSYPLNEEMRIAILNARSASLNAEVAGMIAENQHRMNVGQSIAYGEEAFNSAIERNGLGENGITLLALHGFTHSEQFK